MIETQQQNDLVRRIIEYRVDFCYSKQSFFAAAKRIRTENNKRFIIRRSLNIAALTLAFLTASGVAFYFTKINEDGTVIAMGFFSVISLSISIYLIIENKEENADDYIRAAEDYLELYKHLKNIEAKVKSGQISDEELAREIDIIEYKQLKISSRMLITTDEDYSVGKGTN
jgi:ADP-dependent phosphofructokinase/glucokinase